MFGSLFYFYTFTTWKLTVYPQLRLYRTFLLLLIRYETMVKKCFVRFLLLGLLSAGGPISEVSAQDTIVIGGAWPNKTFTPDLTNPTPSPSGSLETKADSANAGWVNFWMYDDGVYSRLPDVSRSFPNNQEYKTALKVRGKYTDDPEPPRMPARVPAGGVSTAPLPADSMQQGKEIAMVSNWGAARIGDTVYLALSVKNLNDAFQTRSGRVSVLFPRNEFRYLGEIFPSSTDRYGNVTSTNVTETATLCDWTVSNIPINQAQTLFIEMMVTDKAMDSVAYQLEAKVDWDDEQTNTVPVTLPTMLGISKDKGSAAPPNPFYFEGETAAEIKVNRSRDPNALVVSPGEVTPAAPAPVHKLEYTVFVENIGTATTPNLKVEVTFDNKINLASYAPRNLDFQVPAAFPAAPCCTGNKAVFEFIGINLPSSRGGANPAGKGSFSFTMDTKPGLNLRDGDKIRATGVIKMVNNNFFEEDVEATGPAIVHVREPARLCYGWLLGLKYHNFLPNPDSLRNTGLNLTFQVPLVRAKENTLKSAYLKAPRWFWQFELGLGKSTFNLEDQSRAVAKYVHLTPAQIRYTHIPAGPVNLGLSAGYSLGYVYDATRDGVDAPLKSGLGNRLEHELAVSLDAFNMTTVPGISLGAGYKYRFNQLFEDSVSYHFPFVYLQFNFAHFQKRQIQLINKIYRW